MKDKDRQTAEGILFTDQYQLTMAQLYFRMGIHEQPAQFDHFFRDYPDYGKHQAGYCVNAGLEWLLDWLDNTRFRAEDLEYMRAMRGRGGEPLFAEDFLAWLAEHGHFGRSACGPSPKGGWFMPTSRSPWSPVRWPWRRSWKLRCSTISITRP